LGEVECHQEIKRGKPRDLMEFFSFGLFGVLVGRAI
jgi:hypothetical protein